MAQRFFPEIFEQWHLLKHPFYQDWMAGKLSRATLQDYASQYFTHVEAFPRYLSAIHSQCENPSARKVLLENLNDEEGHQFGKSHPDLWLQFAQGLGVSSTQVSQSTPRPAIAKVKEAFFKHARSSFHEGLGALYAYECQVPEIAESKITGLKEMYQVKDPETLQFFEVHRSADVYHREALEKILAELPEKERAEAQAAALDAAQALWNFLSEVHERPHVH